MLSLKLRKHTVSHDMLQAGEPKPTDGRVALLTAVDKMSYLLRDDMFAWHLGYLARAPLLNEILPSEIPGVQSLNSCNAIPWTDSSQQVFLCEHCLPDPAHNSESLIRKMATTPPISLLEVQVRTT